MFASREVNSKTKDLTCGFTSGEVFHHCTFYVLKAQQVTRALSHVWEWQRLYPAAVLSRAFFLGFSASLTKMVLRAVCQAHGTVG